MPKFTLGELPENRKGIKIVFKEIIAKNSPNWEKKHIQIKEAQRIPVDEPKQTHSQEIPLPKWQKLKVNSKILKAAKEKDILNRPITSTSKLSLQFLKFPENKVQDQAVPWGNATKPLSKRVLQIIKEDETLPNSSQGHQYSVIKSRQRHYKKDNYRPISLDVSGKKKRNSVK